MGRFSLKDLGQPVSLQGAREYLIRLGWQLIEEENRVVCKGPPDDSGRPIVQILPAHESYADCALRLEDLIAALAAMEDRPAVEIAREMCRGDKTTMEATRSLADELIDEFVRRGIQLAPGKDRQEAIGELRALLSEVEGHVTEGFLGPASRSVAILAARLARLIADDYGSRMYVGWACERALAAGRLTLRLSPREVDELFALARVDALDSPDEVFVWLDKRAKSVEADSPAPELQDRGPASAPRLPGNRGFSRGPVE